MANAWQFDSKPMFPLLVYAQHPKERGLLVLCGFAGYGLSFFKVVYGCLQDSMPQTVAPLGRCWQVCQNFPGVEILYGVASGIYKGKAVVKSVHGERIDVVFTQYVAAKREFAVLKPELSQQGCGQVRLVANFVNDARAFDSPANPQHGDVITAAVTLRQTFGVTDAVVRNADDKHILPCRCLLQFGDELPKTMVCVCHGIRSDVVLDSVVGDNPWFVAG